VGRLCSSGSAGSSPSGSTACAAGGGGIRRPESLDLERLACGPDLYEINNVIIQLVNEPEKRLRTSVEFKVLANRRV
jgi:hypothetical protein